MTVEELMTSAVKFFNPSTDGSSRMIIVRVFLSYNSLPALNVTVSGSNASKSSPRTGVDRRHIHISQSSMFTQSL